MLATIPDSVTRALAAVDPCLKLRQLGVADRFDSVLCWGKAAERSREAFPGKIPSLVISPRNGEHPLPGPGSFENGERLLEFFDGLRESGARRLAVVLSGGASSLAWLRPWWISQEDLLAELSRLYREPLSIEALNRKRSRLCALKSGGAARWLTRLAPRVRAKVFVLSDVAPHGLGTVGSGPFWGEGIAHQKLADNVTLVRAIAACFPGAHARAALGGSWEQWVSRTLADVRALRRRALGGVLIYGGEPTVALPARVGGRGGRMTQVAAALAAALAREIGAGEVEIYARASDGVDGRAGAAGAWVRAGARVDPARLSRAVREFDARTELARLHALLPEENTGTNVQDVVVIKISGKPLA